MGYNSFLYLGAFLPAALVLYQLTPEKYRKYTLLAFSWTYFFLLSRFLVLYLILTSVFVYVLGLWMGRKKEGEPPKARKTRRARLAAFGILVLFGILLTVKYSRFAAETINSIRIAHAMKPFDILKIAVPVGISYYTLEAAGYLLEVKWKRIKPERDFVKLALFLGFFPQTMEGPIARYQDTADQLVSGKDLQSEDLRDGSVRILWGLFKKMVIADRLNTLVATFYNYHANFSGAMTITAGIAYTLQLYMDFSGTCDIIIGSAQLFGICLPENFRQPFFSQSASEFWRRWHISLGVWLKTYVFYPVSVSGLSMRWMKFSKERFGKYVSRVGEAAIALFPVWLFNGIWHGPQWNYLVYGMYYFVLLLLETILEPAKTEFYRVLGLRKDALFFRVFRTVRTLCVIVLGEMFFRADGLRTGLSMVKSIFGAPQFSMLIDGTLLHMGLDPGDFAAILLGTVIVIIYDCLREKGIRPGELLQNKSAALRWSAYYALIFAVIIFGAYGPGYQQVDMIYAGF